MTDENAIKALKLRLDALDKITSYSTFISWQESTTTTIEHLYPSGGTIQRFSDIDAYDEYMEYGNGVPTATKEAKDFIETLINNIDLLGLQKNYSQEAEKGVNVTVTQSNDQNQSTQVSIKLDFILNAVKGELRDSEIEELKEILAKEEDPKEKKKRFIDKIKSFGSGVASNILANILTNPEVYAQFGSML